MANEMLMPLSLSRQYSGSLDSDYEFATLEELKEYATTSALSYSGQVLYCKENDTLYKVNNDKTDVASLGSGGGEDAVIPYIGDNGNWYVNENDTGVPATGQDGMSAYEVAVAFNGFEGTEEEWLESLKGADGIDGTTYVPNIGTVTTVSSVEEATANVELDNENKLATFNFNIPKGVGVKKVEFTSSTLGDVAGIASATDTYTITFTDESTTTYEVYNGKDCDVQIDDVNDPSETSVWSSQKTSDEIAKVETELINTSLANYSIPLNLYMGINHYLAIKINIHNMNYSFNMSDRSGNIYEGAFFSYNGSFSIQITKVNNSSIKNGYILGFRQYKVSDSEIYLVAKVSDYNYINGVINTPSILKSNIEILVNDDSTLWDKGTDIVVKELATMDKVERFSTTETPIGTWVDGKTIYRIYVSFHTIQLTPGEWNTIDSLSMAGIGQIINARGKRSEDNAIIPLAARSSGVSSIQINSSANFGISKLILEYTKQ